MQKKYLETGGLVFEYRTMFWLKIEKFSTNCGRKMKKVNLESGGLACVLTVLN